MRRQTIGVQIRAILRREIIKGQLLPRGLLSEQDLSQRFGVSRTPGARGPDQACRGKPRRDLSAVRLVRRTYQAARRVRQPVRARSARVRRHRAGGGADGCGAIQVAHLGAGPPACPAPRQRHRRLLRGRRAHACADRGDCRPPASLAAGRERQGANGPRALPDRPASEEAVVRSCRARRNRRSPDRPRSCRSHRGHARAPARTVPLGRDPEERECQLLRRRCAGADRSAARRRCGISGRPKRASGGRAAQSGSEP